MIDDKDFEESMKKIQLEPVPYFGMFGNEQANDEDELSREDISRVESQHDLVVKSQDDVVSVESQGDLVVKSQEERTLDDSQQEYAASSVS